MKTFCIVFLLFLFSCTTTQVTKVESAPEPNVKLESIQQSICVKIESSPKYVDSKMEGVQESHDNVKVRVTKIGGEKSTPSFLLIPDTMLLHISNNMDVIMHVDVVNCEHTIISVAARSSDWIKAEPENFLLKPYEIRRISLTFMPSKKKDIPKEEIVVFGKENFTGNLIIKITSDISMVNEQKELTKPKEVEKKNISKTEEEQNIKAVKPKGQQKVEETMQKTPEVVKPKEQKVEVVKQKEQTFYTVHVASFKTREEALRHVETLPKLEPKISVISYDLGSKGTWYRVLIGLYKTFSEASAVAKHFKTFYGFSYTNPIKVNDHVFHENILK